MHGISSYILPAISLHPCIGFLHVLYLSKKSKTQGSAAPKPHKTYTIHFIFFVYIQCLTCKDLYLMVSSMVCDGGGYGDNSVGRDAHYIRIFYFYIIFLLLLKWINNRCCVQNNIFFRAKPISFSFDDNVFARTHLRRRRGHNAQNNWV